VNAPDFLAAPGQALDFLHPLHPGKVFDL